MMEHNQKLESIASHVAKTLKSFRDLEDALAETISSDDSSEGAALKGLLPTIENDLTRFKMWAGNQAAHQSGPSSLDHRLREAPHLQQQVVYLLKDVCESLQDATSKVSESSDSRSQVEEEERDQDVQDDDASSMTSNQDEESEFSDFDSEIDGDTPTTGLSILLLDVGEAIDCLLRLSVAIANPAPHERFRKLGAGPSEDISFYEPHDITYVRDKFPKIDDELANALGKFITRRRQFFKYRHAHHEKLASGIESLALNKETDTPRTELVPKTVASSLPDQFKTLAKFDPQAAVIDEDIRSDAGMSQTSYATSAGFILDEANQETRKPAPPLRVPPRPSAAEDGIFECPFCYRMISAKTRAAWKRHVFGDLRPYTCVFSHCTESNIDFDRRHNWQLHVSKYHWRSWSCPFECQHPFSSAAELSSHINNHHLTAGTEEELKVITALGEKHAPEDTSSHCLICGHSATGLKKYIKHVGRHLEQLALFALPSLEGEDLEEGIGGNEQNSVKSGIDANSLQSSSTSPSPILAPQQQPSHGLPAEEGEADLSDDTGDIVDPHDLSERALGKQPAANGSLESIQKLSESFNPMQDGQQSQKISDQSDDAKLLGSISWSQYDLSLQKIKNPEFKMLFEDEWSGSTTKIHTQAEEQFDTAANAGQVSHPYACDECPINQGEQRPNNQAFQDMLDSLPQEQRAIVSGFTPDKLNEVMERWQRKRQEQEQMAQTSPETGGQRPVVMQQSQVRLYVCDECQKSFTKQEYLRRHKLNHSSPSLNCPVPGCDKAFHRQELLDRHIQTHKWGQTKIRGKKQQHMRLGDFTDAELAAIPVYGATGENVWVDEVEEAFSNPMIHPDVTNTKAEHSLRQAPPLPDQVESRPGSASKNESNYELPSTETKEDLVESGQQGTSAKGNPKTDDKDPVPERAGPEEQHTTKSERGKKELANFKDENEVLYFTDAVGRKFTFPFHLVATRSGIEDLIQQAFVHVGEIIGSDVRQGRFDLIGPNGEIILPTTWDELVKPGWTVRMTMWPGSGSGPMRIPWHPSSPQPPPPPPHLRSPLLSKSPKHKKKDHSPAMFPFLFGKPQKKKFSKTRDVEMRINADGNQVVQVPESSGSGSVPPAGVQTATAHRIPTRVPDLEEPASRTSTKDSPTNNPP